MKTTLRDIRNMYGEDITHATKERIDELRKNGLHTIAYSTGIYGITGKYLIDNNGNGYKITARTSSLFMVN